MPGVRGGIHDSGGGDERGRGIAARATAGRSAAGDARGGADARAVARHRGEPVSVAELPIRRLPRPRRPARCKSTRIDVGDVLRTTWDIFKVEWGTCLVAGIHRVAYDRDRDDAAGGRAGHAVDVGEPVPRHGGRFLRLSGVAGVRRLVGVRRDPLLPDGSAGRAARVGRTLPRRAAVRHRAADGPAVVALLSWPSRWSPWRPGFVLAFVSAKVGLLFMGLGPLLPRRL